MHARGHFKRVDLGEDNRVCKLTRNCTRIPTAIYLRSRETRLILVFSVIAVTSVDNAIVTVRVLVFVAKMPGYDVPSSIFKQSDDLNHFTCRQCRRVLRDPVQLVGCGCRFCFSCVVDGHCSIDAARGGATPRCPSCREELERRNGTWVSLYACREPLVYFKFCISIHAIANVLVSLYYQPKLLVLATTSRTLHAGRCDHISG